MDSAIPAVAASLRRCRSLGAISIGLMLCLLTLLLYAFPTFWPMLVVDDFQILLRSWTWDETCKNLWVPANEHAMPLGRLTTWLLVIIAGPVTRVPYVTAWQGPLALVAGMWIVYLFVRRELGHPWYGLVAMALFGISTVFQQAVYWYSASFSVVALDFLLLGLLAAQGWLQGRQPVHLALALFACTLAPAWFASGILAGPLCFIYLARGGLRSPGGLHPQGSFRRTLPILAPLMGTALFLAVSLPLTARQILHLDHYQGKTTADILHPIDGLVFTGRSIVDNLFLGAFGIGGVAVPPILVLFILTFLIGGAAWWLIGARHRRLMILGLATVLSNYLLVYSARAEWGYDNMVQPNWSRYHLLPQLGWALFFVGGLTRWSEWFRLDPLGRLTTRQAMAVFGLAAVLFLSQLPKGLCAHLQVTPLSDGFAVHNSRIATSQDQGRAFWHIEEVDAHCREHHISAATAQKALGWLEIPVDCETENNWQFLRGGWESQPVSVEQARQWLLPNE